MIPVLGVPTLARYDLLARMIASIDVPVSRLLVVDNGGTCPRINDARVLRMPGNLGVAASWNLVIRSTPRAPWWCLVNDDLVFEKGDLEALVAAMADGAWLVTLDGFSAFGISRECVETVGYFDENFHPAYCEDADYEYRCRLLGVTIMPIAAGLRHERSSTIADEALRELNARTYPENRRYYAAKWGGDLRGGEVYDTPFDSGSDPSEWTLDHARLVALHWDWQEGAETTALVPSGYEVR